MSVLRARCLNQGRPTEFECFAFLENLDFAAKDSDQQRSKWQPQATSSRWPYLSASLAREDIFSLHGSV